MKTQVTFWFDCTCPWAWMASRWILEVEGLRDIDLSFSPMSLSVLNEGRDLPAGYRRHMEEAWLPARTAMGVLEAYGNEGVRAYYTAVGTKFHPEGQPRTIETVQAALAECGFDPKIAERAQAGDWDAELRANQAKAIELVGDDVGTPVITINGMSLFGPVMSPAPKGEQAADLFDGFVKIAAYDGFFELKRSRTADPIFE